MCGVTQLPDESERQQIAPAQQLLARVYQELHRIVAACLANQFALFVIVAMVLCGGCETTSAEHPKFVSRARALTNLVVLPIPTAAVLVKAAGITNQPLPLQDEVRKRLYQQVAAQWKQRGFHVSPSKLSLESCAASTNGFADRQVWMLLQLVRAYQTLTIIPTRAPPMIVRPEAPLLTEFENADGLVFVRACIVTESSGAKGTRYALNTVGALTALLGGGAPLLMDSPEGCTLEVVLVEGRTGQVLWRNLVQQKSMDGPKLNTAVTNLFAAYPKP